MRAPTRAPKFSTTYMDRTADPRKNFYRYAVGGWAKTHPLPPDKSWYGSFGELDEWNLLLLRKIAEECANRTFGRTSDPVVKLVGGFYRSAMDAASTESAGFKPIEDLWGAAEAIGSGSDVAKLLPRFHRVGIDTGFHAFSKADDKNSSVYAFYLEQGGLSLPDREYYLTRPFAKTRRQYRSHLVRMFMLKGLTSKAASTRADAVLRFETALARASRTRTALREREKNYNRKELPELEAEYPALALGKYLRSAAISAHYVVVGQPEFFKALNKVVAEGDIEAWRAYLSWNALHFTAPYLHRAVREEDFDFFRRKLRGQKKPEPRWKRSVRVVDSLVGEALGRLFVERYFQEEARRRMGVLIDDLRSVFARRLENLSWMSEPTRKEALEKFSKFQAKIGHPPKFRDYSSIAIDPKDFAGNIRRSAAFEFDRQASRVGRQVDMDEWMMTPPTVNAYFEETVNEIFFPAGILQPPFFDHAADDAVNYGAIGAVIGHEITHGYDDQGRKYDAHGNMRDWWTKADKKEFDRRARSVVNAYSAQEVLPGLHANGRLTLGENIADLGGVSIAFEALQLRLAKDRQGRMRKDGMTPEQRFFVSYAQIWREVMAEQEVRRETTTDPHSLGRLRATIPTMNHPAFDEAFPPGGGARSAGGSKIGIW